MSHLLVFHIGPVQDFISTARRTQDLWMGSWVLSHLSKTAIQTLLQGKGTLVLPKELVRETDPSLADTPNYFTARIVTEHPEKAACALECTVRKEWLRIASSVQSQFFGDVDACLWDRQVQNLLEIYWVVTPDGGAPERKFALDALDARKRLRDFSPMLEPGQKCTLCGLRQELSGKESAGEARNWWKDRVRRFHGRLRVRENGNERLCAICAIKRAALAARAVALNRVDGNFPSTSNVAASLFKQQLLEHGHAEAALDSHLTALVEIELKADVQQDCLPGLANQVSPLAARTREALLTYDGDLFYTETFTEKRLKDDFPEALTWGNEYAEFAAKWAVDSLRSLLAAVRSEAPEMPHFRPSKYFAALMMDGDHMGAFFGKASEMQAQALSEAMSRKVVPEAKRIVEEHFGRLVYAGGDDALALLPLAQVLPCAQELQVVFRSVVDAVIREVDLPAGVEEAPTPSIGIAIAHHTSSLDTLLLAMRRAERSAKRDYGRNAVCVHVLKRSGEEIRVGSRWRYADINTMPILIGVVEALQNAQLSMKFAQALAAEARGLAGMQLPHEARTAEIKRLVRRHRSREATEIETLERLAAQLACWANAMVDDDRLREQANPRGIEEIALWVLLARFLATGGREDD